jgi:hypothetical protein
VEVCFDQYGFRENPKPDSHLWEGPRTRAAENLLIYFIAGRLGSLVK